MEKRVYCISYDLLTPGKDYESLINAIKSYGVWWHQTGSVWMITSNRSAEDIRDYLMNYLDENDKIFVIEVVENWGGRGFSKKEYDWVRNCFKQQ
jgi:hypothetical protein